MRHFTLNERLLIMLKRREAGLSINQLSKQMHMCKSNLSRIENDKIMVSPENEEIFGKCFNIDLSKGRSEVEAIEVFIDYIVKLLVYYRLFSDYSKEELDAKQKAVSDSIAYPYYLLIKLFVYAVKNIDNVFVGKYIKIFSKLVGLFEDKYQKLYFISKMNYLYSNKQYESAMEVCKLIENNYTADSIIDSYFYHLKANLYGCLGQNNLAIETLDKALLLTNETNNSMRLLALHITKGNCMRLQGRYLEALAYDERCYAFAEQEHLHIYDYALLRNTGWTYYLLSDYKNAIKYYKIAEKLDIDDDLCFMTAYSSFCLAEVEKSGSKKSFLRHQCRDYLKLGKTVKNSGIAFPYLIDWLNLMLQKKYSMKAEQKLLYCLKKHENTMHIDSRNNIYKFLAEHYEYHHDDDKARIYREKLKKK